MLEVDISQKPTWMTDPNACRLSLTFREASSVLGREDFFVIPAEGADAYLPPIIPPPPPPIPTYRVLTPHLTHLPCGQRNFKVDSEWFDRTQSEWRQGDALVEPEISEAEEEECVLPDDALYYYGMCH